MAQNPYTSSQHVNYLKSFQAHDRFLSDSLSTSGAAENWNLSVVVVVVFNAREKSFSCRRLSPNIDSPR